MTLDEWLKYGKERGWCSDPVCDTHEGLPMSEPEKAVWDVDDFCIYAVRLYRGDEVAGHG